MRKRNLKKTPQSICDRTIEVFAMLGAAHIGRNVAQMSRGGIRICQCTTLTVVTTSVVAGQVDGEPYLFAPSKIKLTCLHEQASMLYCKRNDPQGEKLIRLIGRGVAGITDSEGEH